MSPSSTWIGATSIGTLAFRGGVSTRCPRAAAVSSFPAYIATASVSGASLQIGGAAKPAVSARDEGISTRVDDAPVQDRSPAAAYSIGGGVGASWADGACRVGAGAPTAGEDDSRKIFSDKRMQNELPHGRQSETVRPQPKWKTAVARPLRQRGHVTGELCECPPGPTFHIAGDLGSCWSRSSRSMSTVCHAARDASLGIPRAASLWPFCRLDELGPGERGSGECVRSSLCSSSMHSIAARSGAFLATSGICCAARCNIGPLSAVSGMRCARFACALSPRVRSRATMARVV